MGAPIRASMDVQQLGTTADGVPVFHSVEAARADAIVVINRIKPHTDFRGPLGSGVMKMLAIGLGKRTGAEACHIAASRLGHERVVRSVAQVILRKAPFLCGVGILENQIHDTAKLAVLPRETLEAREAELLGEAAKLLPKLPFDDVDLLIVDALGKNISGAGMDTNVIHRGVQGYSSSLIDEPRPAGTPAPPRIRRIFVRGLTPETHGNAVGIGMADFTTTRLVNAMDRNATYINALTALTGQCAKIPVHFDSDRDAIAAALASLAVPDTRGCKVIRIADTLSLKEMEVSEAYLGAARERGDVAVLGEPCEMQFDGEGNLALKAI
jgi:hypothetical protein